MTVPGAGGRTFAFGGGTVEIGADGAVVAVRHPVRDHSVLLEEDGSAVERLMHDAGRRWGKGFVVTDAGSRRWDAPARLDWRSDGVAVAYDLGPLALGVTRRVSDVWAEDHVLLNRSSRPVRVGSLALSTPWRDVYLSSAGPCTPTSGRAVRTRTSGPCPWTARPPVSAWS